MNNWKDEAKEAFEKLSKVDSVEWLSSVQLLIVAGEISVGIYLLDPISQSSSSDYEGVVVWKDQWVHRGFVILARLDSMLAKNKSIFARKTEVVRPVKAAAVFFQQAHHLNTALPGKYRVGLSYQGELVALAVFGITKIFNKDGAPFRSAELLRFCNFSGITVIGGLSKCLKFFIKEYHPDDIMTYVDMEWGKGDGFKKVGFEEISRSEPVQFYMNLETSERVPASYIQIEKGTENQWVSFYNKGNRKLVWTLKK